MGRTVHPEDLNADGNGVRHEWWDELLRHPEELQAHIQERLASALDEKAVAAAARYYPQTSSSVLLLLGCGLLESGCQQDACIILNRRSRLVRQAGDLCCPGGTVERGLDPVLARLISLPPLPLGRWPHWRKLKKSCPRKARLTAVHLATCLRESWEEMRLNPLKVRFLGPLPPEKLRLFTKVIHPLVGWIEGAHRFVPNWEVDRIVAIPLRKLLDPENYYRYRLYVDPDMAGHVDPTPRDFRCFLHQDGSQVEVLWGATFRIVTLFLERVFDFVPPDVSQRPFVPGLLNHTYLNGTRV